MDKDFVLSAEIVNNRVVGGVRDAILLACEVNDMDKHKNILSLIAQYYEKIIKACQKEQDSGVINDLNVVNLDISSSIDSDLYRGLTVLNTWLTGKESIGTECGALELYNNRSPREQPIFAMFQEKIRPSEIFLVRELLIAMQQNYSYKKLNEMEINESDSFEQIAVKHGLVKNFLEFGSFYVEPKLLVKHDINSEGDQGKMGFEFAHRAEMVLTKNDVDFVSGAFTGKIFEEKERFNGILKKLLNQRGNFKPSIEVESGDIENSRPMVKKTQ